MAASAVVYRLQRFNYACSDERALQDAMQRVLCDAFGVDDVVREPRLSPRDRPDFTVTIDGQRVAIEVKVGGPRNAALRQLGRYAEHDTVDALVLAATRRTLLAGMPLAIHRKPLALALLAGEL